MNINGPRKRLAEVSSALRSGMCAIAGLASDRSGAVIIDYAFLAGLVALAAIQGFYMLGGAVGDMYDLISAIFVESTAP